jgi:hypothetical protein
MHELTDISPHFHLVIQETHFLGDTDFSFPSYISLNVTSRAVHRSLSPSLPHDTEAQPSKSVILLPTTQRQDFKGEGEMLLYLGQMYVQPNSHNLLRRSCTETNTQTTFNALQMAKKIGYRDP